MRPVNSRPMRFHVWPVSVDLYVPLPIESAGQMMKVSPVPAQTCLESLGAIARLPSGPMNRYFSKE